MQLINNVKIILLYKILPSNNGLNISKNTIQNTYLLYTTFGRIFCTVIICHYRNDRNLKSKSVLRYLAEDIVQPYFACSISLGYYSPWPAWRV